ncbi:hypothetical protein JCM9743_31530 [Natrinema sp. JCM 9743]
MRYSNRSACSVQVTTALEPGTSTPISMIDAATAASSTWDVEYTPDDASELSAPPAAETEP